jgi:hypothetical protein
MNQPFTSVLLLLLVTRAPLDASSGDSIAFSTFEDYYRQPEADLSPQQSSSAFIIPDVTQDMRNEKGYIYNCSNCPHVFKKWIHDENELHEAAYFCGFDYLSVRFTQLYAKDSTQSTLVVYAHSLPDNSLQVDSVTTSFDIPRSTEKTTAKIIPQPHLQPCLLLPSVNTFPSDISEHLTTVLPMASRFRSLCIVGTDGIPAWSFTLQQRVYTVRDGEITQQVQETPFPHDHGTAARAYRLETWGTTVYIPSPHRREHATRPVLTITSVNDSQSIAHAGIIAESEYGLSSCIVSSGSISDTLRFSGEKQWHNNITVNARPDDTLLTVMVIDIHGNKAHRSTPLFVHQHALQQAKKEKREMELYTREIARNNPLLYGTWLLGQFSGNPVSYLAGKALDHHAKRRYSTMGNYTLPPPSDTITFPLAGNVHSSFLESSLGQISTPLSADAVTFNGTQISMLVNPRPFSKATGDRFVNITLQAPFTKGKHPIRWKIDSIAQDIHPDTDASSLLLCTSAEQKGEKTTLHNIPHILDHSSNQTVFTLCHFSPQQQADTITITYRIRYTDCSTVLLYEQYCIQNPGIVNSTIPQPAELHTIPSIHVSRTGQSEVLLHVTVVGKKDIFRIDAFVHSRRQNRITGWGAASLPG